jgi:hypothetical protein
MKPKLHVRNSLRVGGGAETSRLSSLSGLIRQVLPGIQHAHRVSG